MLLAATFLVGEAIVSGPSSLFAQTLYPVNLTLPAASLDLNDLDLRDKNNKRITSLVAKEKMRKLFVGRLNQMLLLNLTPRQQQLIMHLEKTWDLLSGWLKRKVQSFYSSVQAWIQKKKEIKFTATQTELDAQQFNGPIEKSLSNDGSYRFLAFLSTFLSSTFLLR